MFLRCEQLLIPEKLQAVVVQLAHEGHFGYDKALNTPRQSNWFAGMADLVRKYVLYFHAMFLILNTQKLRLTYCPELEIIFLVTPLTWPSPHSFPTNIPISDGEYKLSSTFLFSTIQIILVVNIVNISNFSRHVFIQDYNPDIYGGSFRGRGDLVTCGDIDENPGPYFGRGKNMY